ncbi:MAG: transglycosylase domain-containing protein [Dysgonamonadaceae bacterium]|jgi:penicillin-binding protein 1A|nr:transglycosylase domain-containing protein [Dysgonamonadaceae bacterium]
MKKKDNPITRKIIKWFWIFFVTAILGSALFFLLIIKGVIGYMPPVEDLENPISKYASVIVSADQKSMGTFAQSKENRIYVNYKELSPYIIEALISTEDERFMDHSGIDAYALLRAFIKSGILFQKSGGGGSTITQQLAKQLYSDQAHSLIERISQKPIEWVIAVQLERFYTKEEIINMYLNQFDFLYNAVGIQSACWVYFGKVPKDLTVEEAATLIGMCKNPSYFNPLRKVERTAGRRNVVLDLMQKNGYLMAAECELAKKQPLVTHYHKVDHKEGIAPYFREYLRLMMTAQKPDKKNYDTWHKQKFSEDSLAWATNPLYGWCAKNKKSVYIDGLKIYTTIDSRMQTYAEQAVDEHIGHYLQDAFFREKAKSPTAPFSRSVRQQDIDQIMERSMKQSDRYYKLQQANASESEIRKSFNTPTEMNIFSWSGMRDTIMTPMDSIRYMKSYLRTGFMAMDSHSGAIKAYVGGINFQYFQYDMVSLGKRQVGSTIKPFLYSLAMESGFTPCTEVMHVQQELLQENGKIWRPRAPQQRIGEMVSVRWGLQHSDNWVTAALMKQLSPYTFVRLLRSYGLQGQLDPVVSLCLGSCDASISEMVSAYSTFVNGGARVEPMFVTRIEDINGNTIASFSPRVQEVISEAATYKMLSMLRSVIDGGTGYRMRFRHKLTVPMGGKTGTTQNNSDGWFMGFTPSLVGGCWVGGEDRSIHFDRMTEGQGASMALPIMGYFLKKVYDDPKLGYSQSETFAVPSQYSDPCPASSISELDDPTIVSTYGELDDNFQ